MQHSRSLLLALSVGGLAALETRAQDPVALRLAPPVGQVSQYEVETQMWTHTPQVTAADSATPTGRWIVTVTQVVARVEGDARELRLTYDLARIDTPGAPGKPEQMANMMAGLASTVRMDTRGRVLSWEVNGGNVPPELQQVISQMSKSAQMQLPSLPEGAVAVGESWADSQSVTVPMGPGQVNTMTRLTNRLDRVEREGGAVYAVISGNGTLTMDSGEAPVAMTGSIVNEVVLDLSAGRLVRATYVQDLLIVMSQTGQSLPMRMVTTQVLVPIPPGAP
jgi:hypothetical protein